jgi:hypothetical protein
MRSPYDFVNVLSETTYTRPTTMTIPKTALAITLAAFFLPGIASAQYLLDTGTPTNFTTPLSISSAGGDAVEFSLTQGESLQQIALYLTAGTGNFQNQFLTLNLFDQNLTTDATPSAITSFQLEYTASGWNSLTTSYQAPVTGDYWLTIATSSSGYTFEAPGEATQPTGTVPAINFETKGSREYSINNSASFGIQIGAVPEPSSWALGLIAAATLFCLRRRALRA